MNLVTAELCSSLYGIPVDWLASYRYQQTPEQTPEETPEETPEKTPEVGEVTALEQNVMGTAEETVQGTASK